MRKIMSLLLVLCLVVGMMPLAASATDAGPWAVEFDDKDGPQYYDTFDAAFEAVKAHEGYPGSVYTIRLTQNVKESITINNNETAVLFIDSGVTLTNEATKHTITVKNGGSLLVEGNGIVDNVSHEKGAVYNNGFAELRGNVTFDRSQENGLDDSTSGGNSWYTICNHGDMVISQNASITTAGGGENLSTKGRYSSLVENGYYDWDSGNESSGYVAEINAEYPSLTIDGGNFSGGLNTIKNDDNGIVEIRGGNFENYYQSVVQNHHKATITGGTFTAAEGSDKTTYGVYNCACAADHDIGELEISDGIFNGADFAVADVSSVGGKITISGGSFDGSKGDIGVSSGHTGDISISGGTFSSNVEAYLTDDVTLIENDNDTYTVAPLSADNAVASVGTGESATYYKTLAEAVEKAASNSTVTLLKSAPVENTITVDKNLTINLNGNTITGASGDVGRRVFYVTSGTLTLTGTGTVTTASKNDDNNFTDSSSVIRVGTGSTWTSEAENVAGLTIDKNVVIAAPASYGVSTFGSDTKETLTIRGKVLATGTAPAVSGNGQDTKTGTTITIEDGAEITAEGAVAIYHPQAGSMTIGAATITGTGGIEAKAGATTVSVDGATIIATGKVEHEANGNGTSSNGYAIAAVENSGYAGNATITISAGRFTGPIAVLSDNVVEDNEKATISISGGYFTSDPSEYLAENYYAGDSDNPNYTYHVVKKSNTDAPAEVVPALPNVDTGDLTDEEARTVSTALAGAEAELTAAANTQADQNTVTENAAEKALQDASIDTENNNNITVVVQPYLEIAVEDYNTNETTKVLSLDITPMYRTVATTVDLTGDTSNEIKVKGDENVANDANAVVIPGQGGTLPVVGAVKISIPLPAGFVSSDTKNIYVQHKGYEYTATVTSSEGSSFTATFVNPHGFSLFNLTTKTTAVAKIGDTSYTSLQAAVNDVSENGNIILMKGGLTATTTKDLTLINNTSDAITVTINGKQFTIGTGQSESYDYVAPSIPSTPSQPEEPEEPVFPFEDVAEDAWYYDAVGYVYENSLMAGTSDTTFDPETKLTRAMDAQILYNLDGKPTVSGDATFSDMNVAPAWSFTAIAWAQDTGVVAGMGDGSFVPNDNVTREQFTQMMYNYAKYKEYDMTKTGDLSKFPDNESVSGWAETALSWANGNGLINGHDDGTLAPQGNTIRGQAASILMNFDLNLVK